jgi:hypothetical protein
MAGRPVVPPAYKILVTVPYERRFAEERRWTVILAARHPLFNVSYGASPLRRGPLSEAHEAKISESIIARNRLRDGRLSPAVAA